MAAPNQTLSKLVQTLSNYFRIGGANGFRLKNNTGVAQIRNADDSNFESIESTSIKLHGTNVSNTVVLTAPTLSSTIIFTLPDNVGTDGQLLSTDGSGLLSFVSFNVDSKRVIAMEFDETTSSPYTIFTPPAQSVIYEVEVEVVTAAPAGTPTISVGIVGDEERDHPSADNDLNEVAIFKVFPNTKLGPGPSPMIATISPSSQTFEGIIRITYGVPS